MPPFPVDYLKVARNQSTSLFRAFSILNLSSSFIHLPPPSPGIATIGVPNFSDCVDWLTLLLCKGDGFQDAIEPW